MILTITLYWVALCAQFLVTAYAINLCLRAKAYRLACAVLAFGFLLMIGRRIYPIVQIFQDGFFSLADAILSTLISACLLFGIIQIKHILIELEKRNFELAEFAKVDSLTGAFSRPETFSRVLLEIERSLRTSHEISFLMLDIDHFKNINDTYGHPAGDLVLMNLVKRCQEQLRVIDILGRVGGEEFLVVLPDSSAEDAMLVAERLRESIANQFTRLDHDAKVFITISIGIATFNPCHSNESNSLVVLKSFYNKADVAMYQAKMKVEIA